MKRKTEIIKKIRELRDLWIEITELCTEIDNDYEDDYALNEFADHYPFEKSFDEYIWDIAEWADTLQEYLDNKGKLIYDEKEGYQYISPKGIKYDLLEGKSLDGELTSDICFIMNTNGKTASDDEVVGWFYGATFINKSKEDSIDIIWNYVSKYEDAHLDIIKKYLEEGE